MIFCSHRPSWIVVLGSPRIAVLVQAAADAAFRTGPTQLSLPSHPALVVNLALATSLPHAGDLGPIVNPLTGCRCGSSPWSTPRRSLPGRGLARRRKIRPEKIRHPRRIAGTGSVL